MVLGDDVVGITETLASFLGSRKTCGKRHNNSKLNKMMMADSHNNVAISGPKSG